MQAMVEPYYDPVEHLIDELKLLDLQLGLAISRFIENNGKENERSEYSGLYVSEKEVKASLEREGLIENEPLEDVSDSPNRLQYKVAYQKNLIEKRKEQSEKDGIILPLIRLSRAFSLSDYEMSILIFCIAPEITSKYERVYAYLHDDITKKKPTVGLILDSLCYSLQEKISLRQVFLETGNLFRYRILKLGRTDSDSNPTGPSSLNHHTLSSSLKVDGHILNFVLGYEGVDSRLQNLSSLIKAQKDKSFLNTIFPEGLLLQKDSIVELVRIWRQQQKQLKDLGKEEEEENDNGPTSHDVKLLSDRSLVLYFNAEYGSGKKTFATMICSEVGMPLLIVNISEILQLDEFNEIIDIAFREALLYDAVIFWDHFHLLLLEEQDKTIAHNLKIITRYLQNFSKKVISILSSEIPFRYEYFRSLIQPYVLNFPEYTYENRKSLWEILLKDYGIDRKEVDIIGLAAKFNFTPGQIKDAITTCKNIASLKVNDNTELTVYSDDIYKSCRLQSSGKLSSLCRRITSDFEWNELVLPQDKKQLLGEILSYVKYKNQVYNEWGFEFKHSLGKGLNILFAGESGTGKTLAAQIIANELKLDLYKVDLSSVVSKYIGETEQNLDRIFKGAEKSNAILFCDEADALFGKRSEVRQANDKYANIEMAYLLQKLEEHREIVILASNLAKNVDDAVIRRINFWVEFPSVLDEASRFKIWKNIFPEIAPLSEDLDFDYLAKQFQISGGLIKNAALSAAFLAAEESKPISMVHIIKGIKREFDKIGKPCLKSDFNKYYDLLKDVPAQ
jgi:SpoVK/Ycf46/Vps4 family AAA+-type ATPase